jgi:hypothetical protein
MGEPSDRAGATAVAELVYLLDESFAGTGSRSRTRLSRSSRTPATVSEEQWRAVPNGGVRSIESVALHVGTWKVMYDEYAFGPGERR